MRVTWSPRAIRRVVEHARYIALDKPGAAERWLEGAFDAAEPLADFPLSGRIVPELDREDFREVLYGAYRIIYRVFAGEKVVAGAASFGGFGSPYPQFACLSPSQRAQSLPPRLAENEDSSP